MRVILIYGLILALGLISLPADSVGTVSSIYVSANPSAIIADGKSVATISASVRDSSGDPVADGTLVSFSTNIGSIPASATTVAGVARARLTSDAAIGTAIVTAWVTLGGAVGSVSVELLAPGTEFVRESFITLSSNGYMIFNPEMASIHADGGVKIYHRGLSILADEAQLDLKTGELKCRMRLGGEPIRLKKGSRTLDAILLSYQIDDMKGKVVVESEQGNIARMMFRGTDLSTEAEQDGSPPVDFDFADSFDGRTLIKSTSITVHPRDSIQLRKAQIYVDGKKVISIPLHVIALDGSSNQNLQYVGWGANGIKIDLPYYYSLSPTFAGSLRLRRGQSSGWGFYSGNSAWSLDMVQDYATGSGGEGEFTLDHLTGGVWGAHWSHSQDFDSGSRIYTYLDFPAHSNLFGTFNLSHPLKKGSLGLNLYGNKYEGQSGDISSDLYLSSESKSIAGGAASYTLLARTSYSTFDSSLGAGLRTQISGKPLVMGKSSKLLSSLSVGQDWGGDSSRLSILGNLSLAHQMGKKGSAGLIYAFTGGSSSTSELGKHRLSANLFYAPSERWQTRLFTTHTLDASHSSSFADISYIIRPGWRLNLLQTLQSFDHYDFSDTQIALGREIGRNEIRLIWSKSQGKLRLEFDPMRF